MCERIYTTYLIQGLKFIRFLRKSMKLIFELRLKVSFLTHIFVSFRFVVWSFSVLFMRILLCLSLILKMGTDGSPRDIDCSLVTYNGRKCQP